MYKARYYKEDGKKGRARPLPDTLFDGVVNESVMHRVVTAHLSNQRQGSASARNRAAVRGGSRKPWRQKGTGRARQGTIRAPQWEGGGVAFPPVPHSWQQRVPKKVRALARRSALNDRAGSDRVLLADLPRMEAPKTGALVGLLGAMGAEGKVLVLTDGLKREIYLSGRNVPHVAVLPFGQESVYDLLWAQTIVIERSALEGGGAKVEPAEADAETAPEGDGEEARAPAAESAEADDA